MKEKYKIIEYAINNMISPEKIKIKDLKKLTGLKKKEVIELVEYIVKENKRLIVLVMNGYPYNIDKEDKVLIRKEVLNEDSFLVKEMPDVHKTQTVLDIEYNGGELFYRIKRWEKLDNDNKNYALINARCFNKKLIPLNEKLNLIKNYKTFDIITKFLISNKILFKDFTSKQISSIKNKLFINTKRDIRIYTRKLHDLIRDGEPTIVTSGHSVFIPAFILQEKIIRYFIGKRPGSNGILHIEGIYIMNDHKYNRYARIKEWESYYDEYYPSETNEYIEITKLQIIPTWNKKTHTKNK